MLLIVVPRDRSSFLMKLSGKNQIAERLTFYAFLARTDPERVKRIRRPSHEYDHTGAPPIRIQGRPLHASPSTGTNSDRSEGDRGTNDWTRSL